MKVLASTVIQLLVSLYPGVTSTISLSDAQIQSQGIINKNDKYKLEMAKDIVPGPAGTNIY